MADNPRGEYRDEERESLARLARKNLELEERVCGDIAPAARQRPPTRWERLKHVIGVLASTGRPTP